MYENLDLASFSGPCAHGLCPTPNYLRAIMFVVGNICKCGKALHCCCVGCPLSTIEFTPFFFFSYHRNLMML